MSCHYSKGASVRRNGTMLPPSSQLTIAASRLTAAVLLKLKNKQMKITKKAVYYIFIYIHIYIYIYIFF